MGRPRVFTVAARPRSLTKGATRRALAMAAEGVGVLALLGYLATQRAAHPGIPGIVVATGLAVLAALQIGKSLRFMATFKGGHLVSAGPYEDVPAVSPGFRALRMTVDYEWEGARFSRWVRCPARDFPATVQLGG